MSTLRAALPLLVGGALALLPTPSGLSPSAWHYFALFAGVVTGVITEPIPAAAVGLVGVVAAGLSGMVADTPAQATAWALAGFANGTVWLVFAAYMFALGYSRTGLGRRIALHLIARMGSRTLGLGYAIAAAECLLAPFTPSSTARSGATIYPVVRNIPELYDSRPNDPSARRIGAYLLYTAAATSCVTSSLFLTGMAPNVLMLTIVTRMTGITISWTEWLQGFAPVGLTLLLVVPFALYRCYPPGITDAPEAPRWAAEQLRAMGPISRAEVVLLVLVVMALALWIGATHYLDATMVAMVVVVLMVVLRVVSWDDVLGNREAWNVLVWFATLVTLAGGLADTGFIQWLATGTAPMLSGLGGTGTIVCLVAAFYYLHYGFASITAHTATLFPVFLGVALESDVASPKAWVMLLGYSLGLMSILTPYGAGQMPVFAGSGYITRRDFWLLGFVVGTAYLAVDLLILIPWLRYLGI